MLRLGGLTASPGDCVGDQPTGCAPRFGDPLSPLLDSLATVRKRLWGCPRRTSRRSGAARPSHAWSRRPRRIVSSGRPVGGERSGAGDVFDPETPPELRAVTLERFL